MYGIGIVFETATLLGLKLFQSDYGELVVKSKIVDEKLVLLPSRVRPTKLEVDYDF